MGKTTINHMPLTKARINLGQVVRRVHLNREYFILEKGGIPVAGLVHVDDIEDYLDMRDPSLREQIRKSYADYREGRVREASELVGHLKNSRRKRRAKQPVRG